MLRTAALVASSLVLLQAPTHASQRTIPLEGEVTSIAFTAGGGRAWVALLEPGGLVEVDAERLEVEARHELPGRAVAVIAPASGGALALVNAPEATLLRFGSAADGRFTFPGRGRALMGLPGGRALAAFDGGWLRAFTLDPLEPAFELEVPCGLAAPAATGDGRKAFVACADGSFWAVDLWNERLRGRVEPGGEPRAALVLPGDVEVVLALEAEQALAFVNVASHELLGRIPCAAVAPGALLAVSPDGRRLFVGGPAREEVAVIDLDRRAAIESMPLSSAARALAIAPDGEHLWVGQAGGLEVLALAELAPRPLVTGNRDETELCLLATTQRAHLTSAQWGLGELRDTIRRIDPDVICVEIPPDRWQGALLEWRSDGRVSEPRVQKFPEYTKVLLPLLDELEFQVEPCSAWSEELNDLRRARMLEFRREPELSGQYSAYESEVEALHRQQAAAPILDDDPFVLHSEEYDRRAKASMGPFDRYMNEFLGPGGWTNENRAHLALIEEAVARHPNSRILVLCGADRRYWFLERLRQRSDLRLLDPRLFLPGAAARVDEIPADLKMTFDELCTAEVLALHRFFESWMRGERANSEGELRRLLEALGEGFEMVTPDGETVQRAELVARLRAAHGVHAGEDPPFRIWIEKLRVTPVTEGLALASYEEWQEVLGKRSARVSTALMRRRDLAPGGVSWMHVHETAFEAGEARAR